MRSWYVVHTKPRKESLARVNLQRQGFETYLPWLKRAAKRQGRWTEVIEPLFPRYLFLRLDPSIQSIAPIRSTLGVTALVTFGNRLRALPNAAIEILRNSENPQPGLHGPPKHIFEKGDSVQIASGPLEGLRGVFVMPSGRDRAAVLLDIMGRSTTVVLKQVDVLPNHDAVLPIHAQ